MSTDVPVRRYTCSVYFFFFGITCTMTFPLVYWGTYTQIHPKINLPVYPHASLSSNHKDLPVSTTTCVPAHRCTRSWPYLFIFTFISSAPTCWLKRASGLVWRDIQPPVGPLVTEPLVTGLLAVELVCGWDSGEPSAIPAFPQNGPDEDEIASSLTSVFSELSGSVCVACVVVDVCSLVSCNKDRLAIS